MKQQFFLLIGLFITLAACTQKQAATSSGSELVPVRYAQGFTITRFADYTKVEVRDPWDSTRILQSYLLVDRNKEIPSSLPAGTVVRVPIRKVVSYSAVICGTLNEIGIISDIIGVCEPEYIDIPFIQNGINQGTIADLGQSTTPNIEKMIEIGTEVLIVTPFQNTGYGASEKLGLPIIECADYMEVTPLGRAEWIRFFGLFCGKESLTDSIFNETEKNYLALKALTDTITVRPTVFSEKKFGNVWYTPGGKSYMAYFFQDAGADYLFKELDNTGSTPLSFETVLEKAIHADFWFIKYNQATTKTYAELESEYTLYSKFDAFKKRNIYGCNTGVISFYEEVPTHPDYFLKELISIFHPQLLPGYTHRYYEKLAE